MRKDGAGKPTLGHVARQAGVSVITASRALRGSDSVAEATVRRVEDAAADLGYLRNELAGALRGGPSHQVGVILPSLANIVFADVLKGLEDRLEEAGFHPLLGVSNYDAAREERLLRELLAWRPAAIVIAPCAMTDRSRSLLAGAGMPVIQIMDVDPSPIDMAVGMSHRSAGEAMARHLVARGYRRPAYLGHAIQGDPRATARLQGFRSALAEAGLPLVACLTLNGASSVPLGRAGLAQMLENHPRPDVVYHSNDDMAVGAAFECTARGLVVPDDIALAGFNGLEIGQALPVPLTTHESHRVLIGQQAAERLLDRISGRPAPRLTDVGFTLIPGGTA